MHQIKDKSENGACLPKLPLYCLGLFFAKLNIHTKTSNRKNYYSKWFITVSIYSGLRDTAESGLVCFLQLLVVAYTLS